jgi:hypothetical protein
MKSILFVVLASMAFAEGPVPIPADRQEQISRAMLDVQNAQLAKVKLLAEVDAEIKRATDAYTALLAKLQKEFSAAGCSLNMDKSWACKATVPPTAAPAK